MSAEHTNRSITMTPPGILHVSVVDTIGKSSDELNVIDPLISQMRRIIVETKAFVSLDRGQAVAPRACYVKGNFGRVDFSA